MASYRALVGSPLLFDSSRTAMAIDPDDLDPPIGGHDDERGGQLTRYLDTLFDDPNWLWRPQIREVIEKLRVTATASVPRSPSLASS